jgi:hypothetical protein
MQEILTGGKPSPDAIRVATRALALSAIASRGALELEPDKEEAERNRQFLFHWCDLVGLTTELEDEEKLLIAMPVDVLAPQQTIDAVWRGEGLLVLAWCLGRGELEPYDEPCDSGEVASRLGWMQEGSKTVLQNPVLRPRAEIEAWANTYLTLHWRHRQHQLDLSQHSPRRIDLAKYVAQAKWGPLTVANITLVDGDLGIGGKPIDLATEDEFDRTLSIVRERHQALNWLRGDATLYSEVRTPT